MSTKNKIIILVVIFASGLAIGRFTLPSKVVEKEKIVYQDKVVEKLVENKDVKRNNNRTITKTETVSKDGTKTVITKLEDKTVSDTSTKTSEDKKQDVSKEDDKSKETTYNTQKFTIAGMAKINVTNVSGGLSYGALIGYRVIGPFSILGAGYSDGTATLGIGITF